MVESDEARNAARRLETFVADLERGGAIRLGGEVAVQARDDIRCLALSDGAGSRTAADWAMILPNNIVIAAADDRLSRGDVAVLVTLYTELNILEYRPVKHKWLERKVGLPRRTVLRALDRLRAAGYVHQGPFKGGSAPTESC